jgi:hypothetical protein
MDGHHSGIHPGESISWLMSCRSRRPFLRIVAKLHWGLCIPDAGHRLLNWAKDQGKGSAELVGDIGKEARLQLVHLAHLAASYSLVGGCGGGPRVCGHRHNA